MNVQSTTLEQRIAIALQPGTTITSADVAALIEETKAAIAKADESGDPFTANRLRPLLPKLHARHEHVRGQEQTEKWAAERKAVWLAEHEVVKRERDALAEELREVYPNAARRIADLFARIAANDKLLNELYRTRPAGVEQYLRSAELVARGRDGFDRETPSLLTSVHLVDWGNGREICPPPRPSMAAPSAATAMPAYDRRFTADWAAENERRAEARRAEQQRMADFYARLTKEQEERQNAEAREFFMEQQQRNSRMIKP